jgi:hypothetical protein
MRTKKSLWIAIVFVFLSGSIYVLLSRYIDGGTLWLLHVICIAIVPPCILATLHRGGGLKLTDYGIDKAVKFATLFEIVVVATWLTLAWYVTGQIFLILGRWLINAWPELGFVYVGSKLIPETGAPHILKAIYLASVYGVFEEIYFRGLTRIIAERSGLPNWKIWYVIGSSVLFGSIHWGQGLEAVLAAFGIGLMASSYYARWKDLRPLILAHAAYDFWVLL